MDYILKSVKPQKGYEMRTFGQFLNDKTNEPLVNQLVAALVEMNADPVRFGRLAFVEKYPYEQALRMSLKEMAPAAQPAAPAQPGAAPAAPAQPAVAPQELQTLAAGLQKMVANPAMKQQAGVFQQALKAVQTAQQQAAQPQKQPVQPVPAAPAAPQAPAAAPVQQPAR